MNIAIVGCGRISRRHIEALDATEGARLTAVCDIQQERMSAGLLEGRDLIRVSDYADLTGKGIDAVALFKRIDAAGKRLVPVYQNRYNLLVQFVRQLIIEGKLGIIHQYNVNIFWNRNDEYFNIDWHGTRDLDGGVLYTQASHYVDMLLYLFGKLRGWKKTIRSYRYIREWFDSSPVY